VHCWLSADNVSFGYSTDYRSSIKRSDI